MSWLSRLFGGTSGADSAATTAEDYKGFRITPTPIREGGHHRISARIEKDGRVHELIRADTTTDRDEAASLSLAKARQMIDEQGDRLFS